jgi:hypothetical protein
MYKNLLIKYDALNRKYDELQTDYNILEIKYIMLEDKFNEPPKHEYVEKNKLDISIDFILTDDEAEAHVNGDIYNAYESEPNIDVSMNTNAITFDDEIDDTSEQNEIIEEVKHDIVEQIVPVPIELIKKNYRKCMCYLKLGKSCIQCRNNI